MTGIFQPLNTCKFVLRFNVGDLTEGQDYYPTKTTASGNPITGLAYDDAIVESMYDALHVPPGWYIGTDITVGVHFFVGEEQVGTKTCRWALDYQTYNDLDTIGSINTSTIYVNKEIPNNTVEDTFLTANLTIPASDVNNTIERDKFLTFKIYRDSTDSNDTMVGDAVLVLLTFEFVVEIN